MKYCQFKNVNIGQNREQMKKPLTLSQFIVRQFYKEILNTSHDGLREEVFSSKKLIEKLQNGTAQGMRKLADL